MKQVLFFLLLSNSVFAAELHGPHTHGEMELLVQWQAPNLEITLVGSAHDLIGYERDPRSAKEKKALRKFDQKYDPLELIKTNPESKCEFMQGRSVSDMFSATSHKHSLLDKAHAHIVGLKDHVDFMLKFKYECQSAPEMNINIFSRTPSIKKINVHNDMIDGPIEIVLTRKNNLYLVQ